MWAAPGGDGLIGVPFVWGGRGYFAWRDGGYRRGEGKLGEKLALFSGGFRVIGEIGGEACSFCEGVSGDWGWRGG